jgi:hypothetical protein
MRPGEHVRAQTVLALLAGCEPGRLGILANNEY